MNLFEIRVYVLLLIFLANVVVLVPRWSACSRRTLLGGAVALLLSVLIVHAVVRIVPRSRFHKAAASGDIEYLDARLNRDPSLIQARGLGDWTALHHAARHGQQGVIQYLVSRGASMGAMAMGETPFGLAIFYGHYDCVMCMLREGVDANERSMRHRATAIHIAAINGQAEIVRLLLEWGADPNLPDQYGHDTPLTDAKNEEIRRLLLDAGAR